MLSLCLFLSQCLRGRIIEPIGVVLLVERTAERPQVDGVDSGEVIDPIESAILQAAEDHLVDGREVGALRDPTCAHVEMEIVVLLRVNMPVQRIGKKASAAAKRSEIEHSTVG